MDSVPCFSICVPNLRFLLFWDLHLLFWEAFPALRHWILGYLPIWQIRKTAVCVWRNCCGRIVVSDPCTDHPVRWRKTCDAFPSTGGNRPDHYLYRTEPCTVCGQQCIHKLAHCNCGTGGHHYFQYLGKRNVQDYSDSSRCSDFVCVRTGSAGTWLLRIRTDLLF